MSASCSAVGFGFTAQSPNTSTCSGRHMKKTLDTRSQPGTVRMSWRAGRMVWAVVWTAPETSPSASSSAIIMVPTMMGSASSASAFSGVIPFALPPLDQRLHVPRRERGGVDDLERGRQGHPLLPRDLADLAGLAEQHAACDASLLDDRRRGDGARLGPLREHDALAAARAASTRRCRNAGGERRRFRPRRGSAFTQAGSIRSATAFMTRSTRSASSTGIRGGMAATALAAG